MRLTPEASEAVARMVKVLWEIREDRKIFGLLLDEMASLFRCSHGAIFLHKRASDCLHRVKMVGGGGRWDTAIVARFFRNQKPALEADVIMAPVRVGDHVVGVLALGKAGAVDEGAGKTVTEILRIVGRSLGARRRAMILDDANSHAAALAGGLGAKNTAYRVLHGMRRFIDYDHGATLVARLDDQTGRVIARQVAWAKGKSDVVGRPLVIPWAEFPECVESVPEGSLRLEPWAGLASLREEASPGIASALVATLVSGGCPVGLVELASARAGFFSESDRGVVEAYRPCLTLCIKMRTGPEGDGARGAASGVRSHW